MEYPDQIRKTNLIKNNPMAAYRNISLVLAIVFTGVGLLFLFIPEAVLRFFDGLSISVGLKSSQVRADNFYHVLAVGYMYIVTLLAWFMFRQPENRYFPILLVNAKTASSILSFIFFYSVSQTLIYLVNGIVDGLIAAGVLIMYAMQRKAR
jgi:hypothetical protein